MLINMRNGLMAGGGNLSAKSYVQDGLIAMWDGIENVGWGVHDPNATTWVDLSGNRNDLNISATAVQDDHVVVSSGLMVDVDFGNTDPAVTCESVFRHSGVYQYNDYFLRGGSVSLELASNRKGLVMQRMISLAHGDFFPYTENENISIYNTTLWQVAATLSSSFAAHLWRNGVELQSGRGFYQHNSSLNRLRRCGINPANGNQYEIYCNRIYSRVLTAAEIAANYAVDKARFNLPDAT